MRETKSMRMKKILFIILQCTWGIIPTLIGAVFL